MKQETFEHWAKEKGYRVGFAGLSLLDFVRETLKKRKDDGEFAPGFFEENLDSFTYLEKSFTRRPKSILIAAIPVPAYVLRFEFERGCVEAIVPPTYVQYRPLFEKIRGEIGNDLLGGMSGIETLQAPLKSLAVGAGLASYGRNNVTYVPGLGSYYQLAGYILDTPIEGEVDLARLDRKLDLCSSCLACLKACTMGAISEDRFLIRADRCYTLHSESSRPIPANMVPPSPDCIIGCMRCQEVCPANKGLLKRVEASVRFTAEETAALLAAGDISDGRLKESIESKFESIALTESVTTLRRNLRRLLEISSRA